MRKQFILFLIFTAFFATSYSQGKIDDAEDSLKKKDSTEDTKETYSDTHNSSDNGFLIDAVGGLFIQLFAYTAYSVAFETPFEMKHKGHNAFLTKHPYKNSNAGNYTYAWSEDTEIFTTSISNRFIFETNKVYGNRLNIDMKFLKRVGLEFDYLQLWEENTNFGNNALAIYTALAKYNRVRTERFNAWWCLGFAYVDGWIHLVLLMA